MRTTLACCLALSALGVTAATTPAQPPAAAAASAPSQPGTDTVNPATGAYWKALKLIRDGKPADWPTVRALLKEATDSELPAALNFVALCHLNKQYGYSKDAGRAANFFRLSAEQGNASARHFLGRCYLSGTGVRKDRAQAIAWFSAVLAPEADFTAPVPPADFYPVDSASKIETRPGTLSGAFPIDPADQLRASAHFALGDLLTLDKKTAEAQDHYVKAATQGSNHSAGLYDAAIKAAINFAFGQGVPRDMKKADEMLSLSKRLVRRDVLSITHNMVEQKLVDDFAQADVEENATAETDKIETQLQFAIAGSFADPKSKTYDAKEAAKWYELAAEKNEAWAMLSLAALHREGRLGQPDPVKAFEWFKKAAEKGNHNLGWANLSICYEHGLGTTADHAKAAEIWTKHRDYDIVCHLGSIGQCPSAPVTYDEEAELNKIWAEKKGDAHAQYLLGMRFIYGWGVIADTKTAVRWFQKAATANHGAALHELGILYRGAWSFLGCKTEQEGQKLAFGYFQRSAAANNANGLFELGYMYDGGQACPEDLDKAIDAFQRCLAINPAYTGAYNNIAAIYKIRCQKAREGSEERAKWRALMYEQFHKGDDLKDDYCAYNLGSLAYEGIHEPQNLQAAYGYFEVAASRGYPAETVQFKLGQMLEKGEGVPASLREAAYHYRLAAIAGSREALVKLCDIYITKPGFSQNCDRAIYWLSFLARKGDGGALVAIGDALIRKGDYAEALKFFKPLVDAPNAYIRGSAYARLSRLYREGLGVKANPKRAAEYLKQATELGNREAFFRQACDLLDARKYDEALPVLKQACKAGHPGAVFRLGTLVLKGQGLPPDPKIGYELIRRAAEGGEVDAMIALAEGTLRKTPGAPAVDDAARYAEMAQECNDPRAAPLLEKLSSLQTDTAAPTETGTARPL